MPSFHIIASIFLPAVIMFSQSCVSTKFGTEKGLVIERKEFPTKKEAVLKLIGSEPIYIDGGQKFALKFLLEEEHEFLAKEKTEKIKITQKFCPKFYYNKTCEINYPSLIASHLLVVGFVYDIVLASSSSRSSPNLYYESVERSAEGFTEEKSPRLKRKFLTKNELDQEKAFLIVEECSFNTPLIVDGDMIYADISPLLAQYQNDQCNLNNKIRLVKGGKSLALNASHLNRSYAAFKEKQKDKIKIDEEAKAKDQAKEDFINQIAVGAPFKGQFFDCSAAKPLPSNPNRTASDCSYELVYGLEKKNLEQGEIEVGNTARLRARLIFKAAGSGLTGAAKQPIFQGGNLFFDCVITEKLSNWFACEAN